MKILAVSDKVVDWIYSPEVRLVLTGIDLVIGCGDLPIDYLEFLASALDIPVYYVQGNHSLPDLNPEHDQAYSRASINLNDKVLRFKGITIAGIEGSLNYNNGPYQYSQVNMWLNVFYLAVRVLRNKIRYGSYLDVFVTHAPAWGVHDQPDLPHQGIHAFRWFITHFHPSYHLHGHIHVYRPDVQTETLVGSTRVINTYGYKIIEL